ncbi:MAG: hypothetical protein VYA71_07045, partial [Pseudomonadota bacterium]|nr:hypothetical protein [Pseudomonadota bacterium]
NTPAVRGFWEQKLARIAGTTSSHYVETSHLLMKAGLAENIDVLTAARTVHFVVLGRAMAGDIEPHSVVVRGPLIEACNHGQT